jgi:hypothetical protein
MGSPDAAHKEEEAARPQQFFNLRISLASPMGDVD